MKPGDTITFEHYGQTVHGIVKAINVHPGRRERPTTITVFSPELSNKLEIPLNAGYTVETAPDKRLQALTVVMADFNWRDIQAKTEQRNLLAVGE